MSIYSDFINHRTQPSVKAGQVPPCPDNHVPAGFIPRTDNEASRRLSQPERRSQSQRKDLPLHGGPTVRVIAIYPPNPTSAKLCVGLH